MGVLPIVSCGRDLKRTKLFIIPISVIFIFTDCITQICLLAAMALFPVSCQSLWFRMKWESILKLLNSPVRSAASNGVWNAWRIWFELSTAEPDTEFDPEILISSVCISTSSTYEHHYIFYFKNCNILLKLTIRYVYMDTAFHSFPLVHSKTLLGVNR
jgi:hypothetical protein